MKGTILVTGGAGYVGSHACKALAQAGYLPVTYDDLRTGHAWAVKWGPLEGGSIDDGQRLREVLRKHSVQAVLHFAAHAYVGESVEDPSKYYRNNVAGTLTLLDAMRSVDVRRIVFSSSCSTYGLPQFIPLTEAHPQAPINPYGESKRMAERMLADFAMAYSTAYVSLRYFNAAGADPDAEIGEVHDPETHLIPLALETAGGLRPFLLVNGSDYPTRDGTCVRDYVHVSDLAGAHVKALAYLESGGNSTCLNLGTGRGYSVREVIAAAESVTGAAIALQVGPRRRGDPPELVADATLASRTLDWTPRFGTIEPIVQHAWRWLQARSGTAG